MSRIVVLSLIAFLTTFSFPAAADFVRHEEFQPSVTYDSSWEIMQNSLLSGGSVVASKTPGAKLTINFTGTSIAWVSYGCPCAAGIARVLLDGQLHGTSTSVDTTRRPQQTIYRINNLTNAPHVLTIEVTSDRHPYGDDTYVIVDAFDVFVPGTTVLEEYSSAVTFEGEWNYFSDPVVSAGKHVAARSAGAATNVNFTGTSIAWISYQCPCSTGVARVLVDGVVVNDRVYKTTDERLPQREHYRVDGLAPGNHVLRIEATGESAGDTPWVAIDAFHVKL
ncbi:MAG: hypothetical protein V4603_00900 [Pseudomonadota bacterium]